MVREVSHAWIPLSDGCRLSARIWLPDTADANYPVPAILEYVPYRKDDATAAEDSRRHPYFAEHGFAGVRVDLRGTGDSEGVCLGEYLPQEISDALEVLAWIADREWCTGSLGMIGYSWGGFNALQVAAKRPPQLKAIVTLYSTDDRYADDCHYQGGCLLGSDMLKWASWMLAFNARPPDPAVVGNEWRRTWLKRLDATPPYLSDWVAHQQRDDFWRNGSIAEDYSAIEAPVLAVGGWADAYTNAVPRLLEHLECPRRAIIGPWAHVFPQRGVPGPAIGFLQECVRWFDQWLIDAPVGEREEPALRAWIQETRAPADFYAERPGRWVSETAWPPSSVRPLALWLAPGKLVANEEDARAEATSAPASSGRLELEPDQTCGLDAGVWCANGLRAELPVDQDHDDTRSLTFDGEQLLEPVELFGRPVAHLAIACDRPQAIVAVRLCALAPDGASTLVSWGALNLTHCDGDDTPEPLDPGRRFDVSIPLKTIGERVPAGHRLRLAVSSAYWPHLWPSPEPVRLTVWADGGSSLELPVRDPAADEQSSVPPGFHAVEESGSVHGTVIDSAQRTRKRWIDAETGVASIEDRQSYRASISASHTEYAHAGVDRWSVAPDDPLSARAECERTVMIDREGWNVRIETVSSLSCDATTFFLDNELAAYDCGEEVFRRSWRSDVARDGV